MRYFISALLFTLLFYGLNGQPMWDTFGRGSERAFYMIDSSTYLIEDDGDIAKIEDGITKIVWENNLNINSINDFTSSSNGTLYAVGLLWNNSEGRALRSFDQGESWRNVKVPNLKHRIQLNSLMILLAL